MGLKLGKALLDRGVLPFCKLPKSLIMRIVTAYHNISDGFGLSCAELEEILVDTATDLQLSAQATRLLAKEFFLVLDTDCNGLVDGMEMLAVLSGMNKEDVVEFCLSLCDFNNCACLTFDELVLALKTTCSGLTKLCRPAADDIRQASSTTDPTEQRLENIASQVYQHLSTVLPSAGKDKDTGNAGYNVVLEKRAIKDIAAKLLRVPEISSWLDHFGFALYELKIADAIGRVLSTTAARCPPRPTSEEAWRVVGWDFHKPMSTHSEQDSQQWKSQTALLMPVKFANATPSSLAPGVRMELDWVYGFSGPQVLYTNTSDIVYSTGKYVVVYDLNAAKQRVMAQHDYTVTTLALASDLHTVASGEDNPSATVLVWQAGSLELQYRLPAGLLYDGVATVAFNPAGTSFIAVDKRPHEKTLVVVNWAEGTCLFRDKVLGKHCLAATILHKEALLVCMNGNMEFWKRVPGDQQYLRRPALGIAKTHAMTATCLARAANSNDVYIGSIDGQLAQVVGVNFSRRVTAHIGQVTYIYTTVEGLISSGQDAKIRFWTPALEPKFIFDVSRFGFNPALSGVSMSLDCTTLCLATAGGDVYEISSVDGADLRGGPVLQAHAYPWKASPNPLVQGDPNHQSDQNAAEDTTSKVLSVSMHPSKFEFCSLGSDGTLRCVDLKARLVLKQARLDVKATCATYSPLGDIICIGTANRFGLDDCMVLLVGEEHLQPLTRFRDSTAGVASLAYSPEGDTLAVGLMDGVVLLYSVADDYELIANCARHTSPCLYIDFSVNGEWVRTNSASGDLFFFNVDDGALQTNIASMRDVPWATQSCLFSWHTKGMHALPVDNMVSCISNIEREALSLERAPEGESTEQKHSLLAVGSALGQIYLYRYPCVSEAAESLRYPAHIGPVVQLGLTFDHRLLVSAGKEDGCIVVYRLEFDEVTHDKASLVVEEQPVVQDATKKVKGKGKDKNSEKDDDVSPEAVLEEIAFEFLPGGELVVQAHPKPRAAPISFIHSLPHSATHPRLQWMENVSLPSALADKQTSKALSTTVVVHDQLPDVSVQLAHVHGFETRALRGNLAYVASPKEIAYTAGSYACLFNTETRAQRVFKMHHNTITAFACSRDGQVLATGDLGPHAQLLVWSADARLLRVLDSPVFSTRCLTFSTDSRLLAVCHNDLEHSVAIYDWRLGHCMSKLHTSASPITAMAFIDDPHNPLHKGLLVCGDRVVRFFDRVETRFPCAYNVDLAEIGTLQSFLCATPFLQRTCVGCLDGSVYLFEQHRLAQVVTAHAKAVFCVATASKSSLLATGGLDGMVRIWNEQMDCVNEFNVAAVSKCHLNAVRAVAFSPDAAHVLVGLQGAEVLELGVKDGQASEMAIKGHASRLLALAAHPRGALFATAGDDCVLRIYDAKKRAQVKSLKLETGSRALAYSPDGAHICIGYGSNKRVKRKLHPKEGAFVIVAADTLRLVYEHKDSNMPIRSCVFTLDGKYLCLGSEDNKIYVYKVDEGYALKHSLALHAAAVVALDVSVSNNFLQSYDTAGACMHTHIITAQSVSAEDLKDERWVSAQVPQGYTARSHWLAQRDDLFPVAAGKSFSSQVQASGNAAGDVLVSAFPAFEHKGFWSLAGHCGAVARTAFVAGDSALVSIGTEDCLALQYKCAPLANVPPKAQPPRTETLHTNVKDRWSMRIFGSARGTLSALGLPEDRTSDAYANWFTLEVPQETTVGEVTFPWTSQIAAPSGPPRRTIPPVTLRASLEFVHGAQRGRAEVFYNAQGALVYASGCHVVLYYSSQHRQLHYSGHLREISSLAITQRRDICASGERADSAGVHVWDALVAERLCVFEDVNLTGVRCMAFAPSGLTLCSVGLDPWHSIALFHSPSGLWTDGFLQATCLCSFSIVNAVVFMEDRDFPIQAVGESGVLLNFRAQHGALVPQHTHIAELEGQELLSAADWRVQDRVLGAQLRVVLYGSAEGFLFAVHAADHSVLHKISAHQGPLLALLPIELRDLGACLLSAGQDGMLRLWSQTLVLLAAFDLRKVVSSSLTAPLSTLTSGGPVIAASLAFHAAQEIVALSTASGEVLELSLFGQAVRVMAEAHRFGCTHALSAHPTDAALLATAGDDGVVKLWHLIHRYCVRSKLLRFGCRALVFSADGTELFVGVGVPAATYASPKDGTLVVLDSETLSVLREERKAKAAITDLQRGSADTIVAASADGKAYVVNAQTLQTLHIMDINTKRAALRADLSVDSMYLRVAFQRDRLAVFNLARREIEGNPAVTKDTRWASQSVFFAWNLQAALLPPVGVRGGEDWTVTSTALHPTEPLVAVGHACGVVRLLSYPAIEDSVSPLSPPCPEPSDLPLVDQQTQALVVARVATYPSRMAFSCDGSRLAVLDALSGAMLQLQLRPSA